MAPLSKLLFGAAAALAATSAHAHPVEKVIGLLQDLSATAEKEGKAEEVAYTKFARWCTNSKKDLSGTISEEKAKIEALSEEISGHEKNIDVLDQAISALAADLMEQDKLAADAKSERDAGNALYLEEKQSLEETIKAVGDAIQLLSDARSATDTGLVEVRNRIRSVVALVAPRATRAQRDVLTAFVQDEPNVRPELQAGGDRARHVKGYAFKSDSVVELLKGLKLDFEDQLVASNTEETNAVSNYQLAKAARDNLIKAQTEAKGAKEKAATAARLDLEAAQAALTGTQQDLEADSRTLSDTDASCRQKQSEWEERSETRKLEREAIAAAIDILSKATGVRTEAPKNPVPPPSPLALLQLAANSPASVRALNVLRSEAKRVHSQAMGRLADDVETRVKHGDGHFDQVINMIEKMIFRLMDEQKNEDDHKHWCDQEVSKTESSIADKQEKVRELTLKIEEAQARANQLLGDVRAADDMVAQIGNHMQEATEIREIGKEENRLAKKDAEEAQSAIADAVAVLKDFYKKSGGMKKEAYELLQAPVTLPENPSTWDSGYTSVADPAAQPDGIVSVLETVASDFARMESETVAQEQSDQEAYEQEMKSCKIEQARRAEEAKQKQAEAERTAEKQREMEATRKSVAGELEATLQYMKDLSPACIAGSSTYEERRAARDGEIGALKEAQDLLQSAFEAQPPAAAPAPATASKFLQRRSAAVLRAD